MPIQLLTITIHSSDINASLQVGDAAYCSPLSTTANSGFSTVTTANIRKLGTITNVDRSNGQINLLVDTDMVATPADGDYIMFEKDKRVNSSSILGYYADVRLVNYSTEKIELFSVGSEVTVSSK